MAQRIEALKQNACRLEFYSKIHRVAGKNSSYDFHTCHDACFSLPPLPPHTLTEVTQLAWPFGLHAFVIHSAFHPSLWMSRSVDDVQLRAVDEAV